MRVTEIIPLLIPETDTPDFQATMNAVMLDKVAPKARGKDLVLTFYLILSIVYH